MLSLMPLPLRGTIVTRPHGCRGEAFTAFAMTDMLFFKYNNYLIERLQNLL